MLAAVLRAHASEPPRGGETAVQLAAQSRALANRDNPPGKGIFSPDDEKFLDDLQRRGIQFYIDEADPVTGLMPDRAKADGSKGGDVASIASVGFGLTALCIGEHRGWIDRQDAYDRCFKVLRFLRDHGAQERGTFYHFLHMRTGQRAWNCEVSNIDTALLMAGVLTVRQHFPGTELARLADELFNRVEWGWLMTEDGTLSMGWKPEEGFIKAKWDHYSEGAPLILLLGMGSKTYPLPPEAWKAWRRDSRFTYAGLTYLQCEPLFTHQYPQCWFDLRGLRDDFMDFYRNSQLATIAQRQWTIDELSKKYPWLGPNVWGLTASDTAEGYRAWGGPPGNPAEIDGSVVPCAAGGSLAFEPALCLAVLRELHAKYGERSYLKYGFVDALNPGKEWYNADVLGIDVGPTVVMAENARSGFVWKTFMSSPEAQAALKAAGFRPLTEEELAVTTSSLLSGTK